MQNITIIIYFIKKCRYGPLLRHTEWLKARASSTVSVSVNNHTHLSAIENPTLFM